MKTPDLKDSISAVLAAVANGKTAGPLMSELQFLREMILFGNSGVLGSTLARVPGLRDDAGRLEEIHAQFRADLQAFIDSTLTDAERRRLRSTADRVVMVPRTNEDGSVFYHYLPAGMEAALAHALRLLMDPAKSYASDLKQCQWKDCNHIQDARGLSQMRKLFFVTDRRELAAASGKEATGKKPDRYCCAEHMQAAHRARATQATIDRRARLREQKLKKTAQSATKHK